MSGKKGRSMAGLPWIAAMAFFMQALDATILNTALPAIAHSLNRSPLAMQSAIISYTLTVAMLIPVSGWLADRFGTRRVFIIAVVRALAMNPELMLFDEVTASLDPEMVREVLELMLRLAKRHMTMIVVTHEMEFARRVADTVMFLENGVILERQPGDEFFTNPETDRARNFLESMAPVGGEA